MAAAAATSTANEFEEESICKWESIRLKTLAEKSYRSSDLKLALKHAKRAHRLCPTLDGVSEMLTAFKILSAAVNTTEATGPPHWYKILEVEPFSHINLIKKQYKKLALVLHPDKNTFVASEEAFKLVNEAFSVLSDKIKRKEYDMKLRIAIQTEAEADAGVEPGGDAVTLETFWTACSTCRLLHQFERKYLGHILMCPNCKKSFKAVDVEDRKKEHSKVVIDESESIDTNESDKILTRSSSKRKMSSVGEIMKRSEQLKKSERSKMEDRSKHSKDVKGKRKIDDDVDKEEEEEEKMTLAEMQKMVKTNGKLKVKFKVNEKDKVQRSEVKRGNSRKETNVEGKNKKSQDLEIMTVEDSDFYDFDKGRVEKSFKKGQIWALYDDDDGMPRHYGLINEVISTQSFEVDMSWLELDHQTANDDSLLNLERTESHVSCGRFKVSKKTLVQSLNVFSHIVECERAAREVYRIYPKKGSVWALYRDTKEKSCFDIVVFLTSYSEVHGLSMGYLEKVNGFKTIFRRQEIGFRAVRWLEKHDARLFSHQIPARKVSGGEVLDLSGDCWELDPASLPSDFLTIGWQK